jgi:hypothetical protein
MCLVHGEVPRPCRVLRDDRQPVLGARPILPKVSSSQYTNASSSAIAAGCDRSDARASAAPPSFGARCTEAGHAREAPVSTQKTEVSSAARRPPRGAREHGRRAARPVGRQYAAAAHPAGARPVHARGVDGQVPDRMPALREDRHIPTHLGHTPDVPREGAPPEVDVCRVGREILGVEALGEHDRRVAGVARHEGLASTGTARAARGRCVDGAARWRRAAARQGR